MDVVGSADNWVMGVEQASGIRPRVVLILAVRLAAVAITVVTVVSVSAMTVFGDGTQAQALSPVVGPLGEAERLALVADTSASVLRVVARTCGGRVDGSSFVAAGSLFTNRHVVEGADQAKVDAGGNQGVVEVLGRSGRQDVAWMAAPEGVRQLDLDSRELVLGESIIAFGYQGRDRLVAREGTVQVVANGSVYGIDGQIVMLDVRTSPGFSGGPVIDRDGAVVAMLQGFDETTGLSLAVPASELPVFSAIDEHDANSKMLHQSSSCK